jgi:hypothetical protein
LLREGGVWGVSNEAVLGIGRQEHEYHVQILSQSGAAQLVADEVLGVVEDLKVWPAAAVLRRFWAGSSRGLAVHSGAPILVVDPDRPPSTLMLDESFVEEETDETSGEGEASDDTVH